MWIKQPGTVSERIKLLGRLELCSYLLKGDTYAMVGGAMAHVVPEVLAQLEELNVDLERIRHLILLHTHYDHLGMAPYLARHWPWLKVAVSKVGANILENQKALEAIQDYNNSILKAENLIEQMEPLDFVKEGFPVHHRIDARMELNLESGVKLQIIDAPGHSVCSMALYFPREYTLFPSDSIGTLTEQRILPMGSSNYDDFQESIDKLSKIGAETICFEHFGALTPPDGKEFCERAKKGAEEFREEMITIYQKNEDVELTAEEMAKDLYCGLSEKGLVPEDLLRDILKRMVKFVNQVE
jgi:glyoxylase-like metal-dependent hydrolase (beta-lactamase superfamily II)